ncbi:MBL fold metallo-hydrolase [Aerococcaceae bacterium DSM 111022]|nr:MBL fold metallo-hydrolase [Aerococcaceae bacterium DSM 111022]
MKEILPNIFTFGITLPNSPLREINLYAIKTKQRLVLFDTGYNMKECRDELLSALDKFGVELSDVELVLTHLHSDHTGLASIFHDAGSKIYVGEVDGNLTNAMAEGSYWDMMLKTRDHFGLEPNEVTLEDNPGYQFRLRKPIKYITLQPGDIFEVGQYSFEVMDLIGHTPGHIGFYEPHHKFMLSGDTVLDPMTPNITYWGADYPNILRSYITTLYQLKDLDLKVLLATHRKVIENPSERIDEIIGHHQERLQEIVDMMEAGRAYTTREVSAGISWRIKADNWDEFPKGQKWFAAGETLAHLDYLYHEGFLDWDEENDVFYYTKKQNNVEIPLPVVFQN